MKLLVVAGAAEAARLQKAADAAGCETVTAGFDQDLGRAVTAAGAAMVLVAGGEPGRESLEVVRRLRAAAGAALPILFLGDAAEAVGVQRLADACFVRPLAAEAFVQKAITLGRRAAADGRRWEERPLVPQAGRGPGAAAGLEQASRDPARVLRRMAAGIDEALDAEIQSAVRTLVEGPAGRAGGGGGEAGPGATGAPRERPLAESGAGARPRDGRPAAGGESGDLADVDLPMLLGRAFHEGITGRLLVRQGESEKAVYFEAGRPVLAASNVTGDRMIHMLARLGRVSAEQYREATRAAEETGRRMGALLVDLGILKASELLPAVRLHYEEIIFSLFSWESGRWQLEPGVTADPQRIRLLRHPAALVREGLGRGYPAERIGARLGSGRNVFQLATGGAVADVVTELVADGAERRVPVLFDGVRPLEEVARASNLEPRAVAEIALALWVFGLLRPATDAGSARGPGERVDPRDRGIERERVLARHALALDGDYFQIFGIDRQADAGEVRRAHERLAAELAPESLGTDLADELATEVATLRESLTEGLRVLTTPSLRAAYEAHLPRARLASAQGG